MYCVKCGSKLNDDFRFCPYCGTCIGGAAPTSDDFEIVAGVLKKYKGAAVDVVVPEGVIEIAEGYEGPFYNCTSLRSIKLPKSLKKIGYEAFYNCTSLVSIEIPNSVTTVGGAIFQKCTNLKNVVLADSLEEISYRMFEGCQSLESIIIPPSVKRIEKGAFKDCSSLKSITIPDSVTSIEPHYDSILDAPFVGCNSLSEIHYPQRFPEVCFQGSQYYAKYVVPKLIAKNICPYCGGRITIPFFGDKSCSRCRRKF